jgi:hypothetical protein
MNESPSARGIRLILAVFRDNGWRDNANAALYVMESITEDDRLLDSPATLEPHFPDEFLLANDITINDAHAALVAIVDPLRTLAFKAVALKLSPLVQMADIDSFSKVSAIPATDVAQFCNPLNLAEDIVERIIAKIIGEPYLVKDWAGEMDDMFSGQVQFKGRSVRTSFMLKGKGLRGTLKPSNLGHNGDQITRMTSQPADLFVVQFVGRVEPSVIIQLRNAIVARRAEGNIAAVGTIWDGVDTARLGVAYGFLDSGTGMLIPGVLGQTS